MNAMKEFVAGYKEGIERAAEPMQPEEDEEVGAAESAGLRPRPTGGTSAPAPSRATGVGDLARAEHTKAIKMRDARRRHASRGSDASRRYRDRTRAGGRPFSALLSGSLALVAHISSRRARGGRRDRSPCRPLPPASGTASSSNLAASAFSASFAEACTIPHGHREGAAAAAGRVRGWRAAPKYKGMFGTMMTVAREEGAGALWKGITPGTIHPSRFVRRRPLSPRARASRRPTPRPTRRIDVSRNPSSIARGADPLPTQTSQASIARSCSAVCASACTSPSRTCSSAPTTWATFRFT